MHFTPTFLLLASLIGAAQALVEHDTNGVSFMQHRRHHAKAARAATRLQRRSRRSCKLNSSSILAIASATASVDTSPASVGATQTSSLVEIATSTADGSDATLSSSLASVASSAATASGTSQTSSFTMSASTSVGSALSSASATSSSNATSTASSTASSSSPSSTISLADSLLPKKPLSYWSTSSALPDSLPLNDKTLTPTHDIKALKHEYLEKAGKNAMSAFYPKGSWNLSNQPRGGFSFYATGPENSGVDLTKAREVTMGYSVFFPEGFDFVLGGKLPGLWGGDDFEGSISCSGGSRNDKCFSSRIMWRTDGAGELYTYLPPSFKANERVCDVPPYSECNPTYGASIGRGSFTFATGAWTSVAMRVRLNDVGQENGELELWANGESMFVVDGLVIRNSEEGLVWGQQFQTFFGGSTQEWSTPKDQNTYFADFTVAVTETF